MLFFAFLLSINSFAAVVSDNDGAAFVTKAEFEALKQSFSDQINNYNDSIDNKIDGSIASYLAGINIAKKPKNYWDKICDATNSGIWWSNNCSVGTETLTPSLSVLLTRELYELHMRPQAYGWWVANNSQIRHFVVANGGGTDIKYKDVSWGAYDRTDNKTGGWSGSYGYTAPNEYMTVYSNKTLNSDGSGSRWEVHRTPDGRKLLRYYNSIFYPVLIFTVWDHIYFINNTNQDNVVFADGGRSYKVKGSGTAPIITNWGKMDNGVEKQTGTSTTSSNYISLNATLSKSNDLVDYSMMMYSGSVLNTEIVYSYDDAKPYLDNTVGDQTLEIDEYTFYDLWHSPVNELLQTNKVYGYDFTYNYYNVQYEKDNLKNFYNEYVGAATGENSYVGNGCKILENEQSQDVSVACKLVLKTNDNIGNINYRLSKEIFNNDGTTGNDNIIKSGTCLSGDEISFDTDVNGYGKIFINIEAVDSGKLATISKWEFEVK